jgi:hypothetical protein
MIYGFKERLRECVGEMIPIVLLTVIWCSIILAVVKVTAASDAVKPGVAYRYEHRLTEKPFYVLATLLDEDFRAGKLVIPAGWYYVQSPTGVSAWERITFEKTWKLLKDPE